MTTSASHRTRAYKGSNSRSSGVSLLGRSGIAPGELRWVLGPIEQLTIFAP
jgi:hypothetical protein